MSKGPQLHRDFSTPPASGGLAGVWALEQFSSYVVDTSVVRTAPQGFSKVQSSCDSVGVVSVQKASSGMANPDAAGTSSRGLDQGPVALVDEDLCSQTLWKASVSLSSSYGSSFDSKVLLFFSYGVGSGGEI